MTWKVLRLSVEAPERTKRVPSRTYVAPAFATHVRRWSLRSGTYRPQIRVRIVSSGPVARFAVDRDGRTRLDGARTGNALAAMMRVRLTDCAMALEPSPSPPTCRRARGARHARARQASQRARRARGRRCAPVHPGRNAPGLPSQRSSWRPDRESFPMCCSRAGSDAGTDSRLEPDTRCPRSGSHGAHAVTRERDYPPR